MLICILSKSSKDTESKQCVLLLKKSSSTWDLAIQKLSSKYYEESIQTSLASIQIDKYENRIVSLAVYLPIFYFSFYQKQICICINGPFCFCFWKGGGCAYINTTIK